MHGQAYALSEGRSGLDQFSDGRDQAWDIRLHCVVPFIEPVFHGIEPLVHVGAKRIDFGFDVCNGRAHGWSPGRASGGGQSVPVG